MSTLQATWPHFGAEERAAVESVLRSGRVSYWTGTEGRDFEREFAQAVGTRHAIPLTNGTNALELALTALGIGPGDEVVTTPRTFLATASSIIFTGARPVFADVDPVSQGITAGTIELVLSPRTKAIIPVHLAGWPCDMDPIMQLARERGLFVIEDCAQAHGSTYKGRPVGSIGDVGAWSFCQDKIMTTGGEGGMLTTDDRELWSRAWSYKDHGKSWDAVYEREHTPGFRWLHETFGTNWRMTEMQAAIGRVQLRKLPDWTAARRRHAVMLNAAFADLDALRLTIPGPEIGHAYYKYYAFVRPKRLKAGWSRDRIMAEIGSLGVPCFSGSCPEIYLEKAFEGTGLRPASRLPVARELGETSLTFLVHPTLDESAIAHVASVARDVIAEATA